MFLGSAPLKLDVRHFFESPECLCTPENNRVGEEHFDSPTGSLHRSCMYSGLRNQNPRPTTTGRAHSSPADKRCCAVCAFNLAAMLRRSRTSMERFSSTATMFRAPFAFAGSGPVMKNLRFYQWNPRLLSRGGAARVRSGTPARVLRIVTSGTPCGQDRKSPPRSFPDRCECCDRPAWCA